MRKKLLMFFTIFLMICASALAQERTISGMITSAEDGSALPGVNVRVQGSSIGTISDAQGRYSIRVPSGFNTIEFSFIGMESRVVTIGISILTLPWNPRHNCLMRWLLQPWVLKGRQKRLVLPSRN